MILCRHGLSVFSAGWPGSHSRHRPKLASGANGDLDIGAAGAAASAAGAASSSSLPLPPSAVPLHLRAPSIEVSEHLVVGALQNLSFAVPRGQLWAVVGPNGAGTWSRGQILQAKQATAGPLENDRGQRVGSMDGWVVTKQVPVVTGSVCVCVCVCFRCLGVCARLA